MQQKHSTGHDGLYACSSGFVISEDHPFLGAYPDIAAYDPTEADPFGLAEIKCLYSCRQVTPVEACLYPNFSCMIDAKSNPTLRRKHLLCTGLRTNRSYKEVLFTQRRDSM